VDISRFGENKTGKLVSISTTTGTTYAFIPDPLPLEWEWPERLWPLLLEAHRCLARLEGRAGNLPIQITPQLLLRPLQNREAQTSSRLEGTITEPVQQMLYRLDPDAPGVDSEARNAQREVDNYGRALRHWLGRRDKLPICRQLVTELHGILMDGVRGANRDPGQFRRLPVQIGRPARFVPPPAERLDALWTDFEEYCNRREKQFDPLVEAFVAHYQFETIHPFSDGNGRVGRVLLAIMIMEWCGLSDQWLYMSPYFEARRDEYMDRLFAVSAEGDWEGWIEFCLKGVVAQAKDAEIRCGKLITLYNDFQERVRNLERSNMRLGGIVDALFDTPVISNRIVRTRFDVSYPTAQADLEKLCGVEILERISVEGVRRTIYYSPEIFNITFEE